MRVARRSTRLVIVVISVVAISACSTAQSRPPDVGSSPAVASRPRRPDPAPLRSMPGRVGDRLVALDPACSFEIPAGWRMAGPDDDPLREVYEPHARLRRELRQAMARAVETSGLFRTRGLGEMMSAIADVAIGLYGGDGTVLTNASDAYVAFFHRQTPFAGFRGTQRSSVATSTPKFFDAALAPLPWPGLIDDLTLQSIDIKESGATSVVAFVYTGEPAYLGRLIYTVVRFHSETSVVTLLRAAKASDPSNGADGFDAMVKSFRFGN
jgi:hypothetical protein